MPLGKMTAKQLGQGGALHDAIAALDPTSVLKRKQKPQVKFPLWPPWHKQWVEKI